MLHAGTDFTNKLCSQDFNDVIQVVVGNSEPEQVFAIHKDVLCAISKFFQAACSKSWAEGQSKIVRLPEASHVIFRVYAAWIYSGKLAVDILEGTPNVETKEQESLLKSWLLGDFLNDLRFRDQVMKTFVEKQWDTLPNGNLLKHIYNCKPPDSLLRKMLVESMCLLVDRESFASYGANYPQEFVLGIAVSLMKQLGSASHQSFVGRLHKYIEPKVVEASKMDM